MDVTLTAEDYFMLLWCARKYQSRLPYGIIPERLWMKLTPEQQARFEDDDDKLYNR
jgi:hypothetical protein